LADQHLYTSCKKLQATIREITCEGNDGLINVPFEMRGRTDMVLWCMQLQCHYENIIYENFEKYDAAVRDIIQCETLRNQMEEAIHEMEIKLPQLRSMIHDCEPYRRRKAKAKKVRKRLKKALFLLLGKKNM
jgi:hypothetical protein